MWHLLFRITLHGKDEALRLKTDKMETIPIASPPSHIKEQVSQITPALRNLTRQRIDTTGLVVDWLHHTFEIKNDAWRFIDLIDLDANSFVSAVSQALPKKKKLTAAEVAELKREYGSTIEPARQARTEILALETKLSDLVNEAYGLTPQDVDLMWRTAPPRMPFTPAGLTSVAESAEEEADEV